MIYLKLKANYYFFSKSTPLLTSLHILLTRFYPLFYLSFPGREHILAEYRFILFLSLILRSKIHPGCISSVTQSYPISVRFQEVSSNGEKCYGGGRAKIIIFFTYHSNSAYMISIKAFHTHPRFDSPVPVVLINADYKCICKSTTLPHLFERLESPLVKCQ